MRPRAAVLIGTLQGVSGKDGENTYKLIIEFHPVRGKFF
jgi:hypothetical protein